MFATRQPAGLQTQLLGEVRRRVEVDCQLPLPAFCVCRVSCSAADANRKLRRGEEKGRESRFAAAAMVRRKGDHTPKAK